MRTLVFIIAAVAIVMALIAFGAKLDRENSGTNGNDNSTTTESTNPNTLIRVTTPSSNATISSPFNVTGEARGNWYFEASFPVRLLDGNGNVLVEHYAEAQGEWMTTDFVPFSSTLNFSTPTTETGTLVLMKDNPSGLPENDTEIRVPVRFAATSTTNIQTVKLYYYNEEKDKDSGGNVLCSAKGLESVERQIPRVETPIQNTIKELMRGNLTGAEKSRGLATEFPLQGLTLTAASLNGGVLTLTFADPQNKTSGGACRVSVLKAQIESTAKQFNGVYSVKFAPVGVFEP